MLGPADSQETEGLFESRLLSSVWTIKETYVSRTKVFPNNSRKCLNISNTVLGSRETHSNTDNI